MKFGLDENIIEKIIKVFEDQPKVDKAYIFGSRAKGNYRADSDIDIAVKGYDLTVEDILKMSAAIEKEEIGFEVDLLDYDSIKENALEDHIDRIGINLYSKWSIHTLRSLCGQIDYGYTASASDIPTGPKFLRITDIVPYRVNWETVPYCEISNKEHNKYKLNKGDIVIARTGATTGYNYTFNEDIDAVFASYLIRYKIDKNKANPFFIGYVLKSENWKGFVDGIISGSAQPGANAQMLGSFEIKLPSFAEQTRIVESLEILDNKIDLLHRQNKTLESMAETLFRQWFIEKADDDWAISKVDQIATIKGGTTPSSSNPDFWNGDIHWTSPRDLSNNNSVFLLDTERKITKKGLAQIGSGLLPSGTVLLSSRAPIGYLAISEIPVAINQGYIAIICEKEISNIYIYLWCKVNMDMIESAGNGSVFPEISKSSFKELEFIIPSKDILRQFDDTVNPLFNKIKLNTIQIKRLTNMRDDLLPKLLSGEARVKMS